MFGRPDGLLSGDVAVADDKCAGKLGPGRKLGWLVAERTASGFGELISVDSRSAQSIWLKRVAVTYAGKARAIRRHRVRQWALLPSGKAEALLEAGRSRVLELRRFGKGFRTYFGLGTAGLQSRFLGRFAST